MTTVVPPVDLVGGLVRYLAEGCRLGDACAAVGVTVPQALAWADEHGRWQELCDAAWAGRDVMLAQQVPPRA